ncbi:MAG: M81 family metallopeptidase [Inquilinaceae bacterium]
MAGPRIALIGLHLESNAFAPVSTEADFRRLCFLEGTAVLDEARRSHPAMPAEIPAFIKRMGEGGDWTPVPILVAAAEPGGPVDQAFIDGVLDTIRRGLEAAGPLDGAYISNHGAMTATEDDDPDGRLYAMVREVLGADAKIVATVDLHANISDPMVASVDTLIAYRTNPHVDQSERAAEAADVLRALLGGTQAHVSFIRLPLTPPSITLLTSQGPYADLIDHGQSMSSLDILNVSVVGGFVFSDTAHNGLAVIVTGRDDPAPARRLARDLSRRAWIDRHRFARELTSLDDAVALATRPRGGRLIFADAGDNPGGGGTGNTHWLLEALHGAGARGVLLGLFIDPALAAEAHTVGQRGTFRARFNRDGGTKFAKPFEAEATVLALHDGSMVGRRGIWAGRSIDLGPTAALVLNGVTVVVATARKQCADPVQFEALGLDIAAARTVVVKSRGHFRAGFDEFFTPKQVVEVDTPGLTSPVLSRHTFARLPRPVFPLDPDMTWDLPA